MKRKIKVVKTGLVELELIIEVEVDEDQIIKEWAGPDLESESINIEELIDEEYFDQAYCNFKTADATITWFRMHDIKMSRVIENED